MMDQHSDIERPGKARQRSSDSPRAMLPENPYQKKIADWLKKLKFRRVLFGGVSEKQVWKYIGELNEMYQRMLETERARYEVLLHQNGIQPDIEAPYTRPRTGGDGA